MLYAGIIESLRRIDRGELVNEGLYRDSEAVVYFVVLDIFAVFEQLNGIWLFWVGEEVIKICGECACFVFVSVWNILIPRICSGAG